MHPHLLQSVVLSIRTPLLGSGCVCCQFGSQPWSGWGARSNRTLLIVVTSLWYSSDPNKTGTECCIYPLINYTGGLNLNGVTLASFKCFLIILPLHFVWRYSNTAGGPEPLNCGVEVGTHGQGPRLLPVAHRSSLFLPQCWHAIWTHTLFGSVWKS